MKLLCGLMVVLIFQQAIARIVRKPPAFSTPVYSNSYLPAVMQVIFHSVEQLKLLQGEEAPHDGLATTVSSTIHSMKHQQAHSTTIVSISALPITTSTVGDESTVTPRPPSTSSATVEVTSNDSSESHDDPTEAIQRVAVSTVSNVLAAADGGHEESPEANEETAEANYATPETNHESPEPVQELQELNQEVSEDESDEENSPSITEVSAGGTSRRADASQRRSTQLSSERIERPDGQKKNDWTVDSMVSEVYEIVKPTTTLPSVEESSVTDEARSTTESRDLLEKMENNEDEQEDTRFTLLGEKVAQVPRPSLISYLRRAKVPPRRSLQQLANLYDSLSKDARKQGFARFAGYSDDVLKTLHSSAEGGVGPQLKQLLERMIEKNELTREDAKMKTSEALRDLDDSASALNNDLRRILPLRFAA